MDKYTKGVLTVIAVALVSISFQLSQTNVIDSANAVSDKKCDGTLQKPCVVVWKYQDDLFDILYDIHRAVR
tara:strand:+ start:189 stop:401 length:213 start_codon:yes stop_codon:yes gene_type:complete